MTDDLAGAIRGNVLIARLKFLENRGRLPLVAKVLARLSVEDRGILSRTILPITWYPMTLGTRLDAAIAQEISPTDPHWAFVEMGRTSAQVGLTGPERIFLRLGDPQHILRVAPTFYSLYYKVGRRTYEATGATRGILRTFNAESVTVSDCLTVIGWYEQALEMSGATSVKSQHPICRARHGAHCEYHFAWSLAELPAQRSRAASK